MSSNLKVNTILPSTGSNVAIGTAGGTVTMVGNVDIDINSGISTFNDIHVSDKIVHDGDTNTAIRFPAADTITAETGGSERLRIDSSGNVTISTGNLTIPDSIIHSGDTDTKIAFTNNQIDFQCAGSSRAYINNYAFYVQTGLPLAFLASSGPTPNIKSGGTNNQDLLFTTGSGNPTRLQIKSDGTVIFANKLTNSSAFTSHNTNFYGGDVNTGGVRIEVAHSTTTVSGNTASAAFPHHLLLSNYSGSGSADNRMCSIGFDIPTTSTHANAVIAYQATAGGTGDLQFHLESGNTSYERLRITSGGQLLISGNTGWNESSSLLSISTDAAAGANMLSNSSAIYNHNNPAFIHVQNRYNTGTGQEAGIIFHSRSSHNGCWAIYGKRTSSSYLSDLIFRNRNGASSSSERMKITSDGYSKHTSGGGYDSYVRAVTAHEFRQYINSSTLWTSNTNSSQTWEVIRADSARSATNAMNMITTTTGNLGDDQHRLIGNGDILCDGTAGAGAADYAEYFEWEDGNTSNEDRRGYSVVLNSNGKIEKATEFEDKSNIIGVVSANPVVVGDAQWRHWQSKYLRDDYGNYIYEDHNQITWTDDNGVKHDYEDWNVPSGITVPNVGVTTTTHDENGVKLQHQKLNPSYDASKTYIPRSERKEWDAIGMVGKLRVRKGQITGTRWIKMKDISDNVEEWLVR